MQQSKNDISLLLILTAIVTLIIMSISCNDNPVAPGNEPPPGRRDYEWSVDTLISPMWLVEKMWGSSPQNVWVIGGGGGAMERIWHYDGNSWRHPEGIERVGPSHAIYGLGENKMWVGGVDGQITFYDGNSWTESYRYTPKNSAFTSIEDIYGHNENDVYAVGLYALDDGSNQTRGFILHYDGVEWKEVLRTDYHSYFYRILPINNKEYYVCELRLPIDEQSEFIAVNKFNGTKINNILIKNINELGSWVELHKVDDKFFIVLKDKIYKMSEDGALKLFLEIELTNFNYGLWGTNKNLSLIHISEPTRPY